jgi:cytochrome c oxidase assembly protein subunit 15
MTISYRRRTWFQVFGIATIVAVYFLILVGGIVRSTGSGMGCPDWPRCFGKWIPPTNAAELPQNYKEKYVTDRLRKNERVAKMLTALGWTDLAYAILHDKNIREETDFNAVKTWIEYINRLIGVVIGLLIFLTCVLSFAYRKTKPWVVAASLAAFVLVGFEGWLGSIVVSTNLLPGLITAHMMLAIVIVFLLTFAVTKTWGTQITQEIYTHHTWINILLIIAIILSCLQVMWGTEVREAVDITARQLGENRRGDWLTQIGYDFYWHRSFSWAILLVNIGLIYCIQKYNQGARGIIYIGSIFMIGLLVLEIGAGIGMAYFAIPPYLQPMHLLLGTMLVGVQFFVWLVVNQINKDIKQMEI